MANLQELMPFFQELAQQWLQLTLNNVSYAVALGASVWLLSAIIYNLRIALFKRRHVREQLAHAETQNRLDAIQQELTALQAQTAEISSQLEQSQQELSDKNQQVSDFAQRLQTNQNQLVDGFASLVKKFELIEQLPSKNDPDGDAVWNRCNAIIERISERFSNEQQAKARLQLDIQSEKVKATDKELLANNLQKELDSQAEKMAQLQSSIAEQTALREERDQLAQQLANLQSDHATTRVRMAELEQQTRTSITEPESSLKVSEPEVLQTPIAEPLELIVEPTPITIEPILEAKQASVEPKPIATSPTADKAPTSSDKSKWKNLFGNAMQQLSSLDKKLGSSSEPLSSSDSERIAEEEQKPAIPVVKERVIEVKEPQAAPAAPNPVKTEKPTTSDKKSWKNALGNAMQQFAKMDEKLGSPSKVAISVEEAVQDEPAFTESAPKTESQGNPAEQSSKLGGLLGKFKKK